jgi:hypothetical protein
MQHFIGWCFAINLFEKGEPFGLPMRLVTAVHFDRTPRLEIPTSAQPTRSVIETKQI